MTNVKYDKGLQRIKSRLDGAQAPGLGLWDGSW